jgi:RNA polymerase sigma-70 factor, ECF subfamily
MSDSGEVTTLLLRWSSGDASALERLVPIVEEQLQRLALHYMRAERPGHSLEPGALVNEAYLRLIDWNCTNWQDRAHFFAVAAKLMRRVLVEHGERRRTQKRGGEVEFVTLSIADIGSSQSEVDVVALDQVLDRLSDMDPRKGQLVELRFFGGLTEVETAEVLTIPLRTVQREWSLARAWLYRELTKSALH